MRANGPGRPRQTTHDEIRAVAFALFVEHGYASTSLAQIARAAGISRTTLFSYFPAKRDLMWDEFDAGALRMREQLTAGGHASPMDVVVAAIRAFAHYVPAERDAFLTRWRLVASDGELRAAAALRVAELSREMLDTLAHAAPQVERERLGDVIHALMAVGERAVDEWAGAVAVDEALDDYLARRLQPLVAALRGLID